METLHKKKTLKDTRARKEKGKRKTFIVKEKSPLTSKCA